MEDVQRKMKIPQNPNSIPIFNDKVNLNLANLIFSANTKNVIRVTPVNAAQMIVLLYIKKLTAGVVQSLGTCICNRILSDLVKRKVIRLHI